MEQGMIDDTRARLRAALSEFDGKAITLLCEAKAQLRDAPGFFAALCDLTDDDDAMIQAGSTWLVLQSVKCGDLGLVETMTAITPRLGRLSHWAAILHMLQAIDLYDTAMPDGPALAAFAQYHLASERPFVRAWAVNALCVLAVHHPELHSAADAARTAALNDKAASVRARARKAPEPV
jgi:hypothetical protein